MIALRERNLRIWLPEKIGHVPLSLWYRPDDRNERRVNQTCRPKYVQRSAEVKT